MNRYIACTLGLLVVLTGGCAVGPDYHRPETALPATYRGVEPATSATYRGAESAASAPASAAASDFAQADWWTVFKDPVLQSLIHEALQNNYDLRIAANRVIQARAQLGVTRANQFPTLDASLQASRERQPPVNELASNYSAGFQLSWMVDFWGQYRRATEAARANLLSAAYAREAVRLTLLADVASNYFELRALDREMAASRRILTANEETLRITKLLVDGGANPVTDELQARLLVQQAQAQITQLEESIAQAENRISVLVGRNPGPIPRGLGLEDQPHMPEVPVGLPSALLEARPDIRAAEEGLVAANADVGVAKAAFFPQIPLTGIGGVSSPSLAKLFDGPQAAWSIGGGVVQPLFEGGRLRNDYKLAQAQRDSAELTYAQTIQHALSDVADALVGYNKSRVYRAELEEQAATYAETARLANDRYRRGATSFLEVLTTEQQYLNSELQLAQAWSAELQNYVQLYRALGGGYKA
jgi:multidrug efflux system outer membrane protein